MIHIETSAYTRALARKEAKEMGALKNSLTKGRGNAIGMLGEILAHRFLGGKRVGSTNRFYDIVTPSGLRVDVKTTCMVLTPRKHHLARAYYKECEREFLATKCDAYFFVRACRTLRSAYLVGWLSAEDFAGKADFTPEGSINPHDKRVVQSPEFTIPLRMLNAPEELVS